jgi:septum formation protein
MPCSELVLASTSKIRASILKNAGLNFSVCAPCLDETTAKEALFGLTAAKVAVALAQQKALSIISQSDLIVGADQTLSCEGIIYNKPNTLNEAHQHLIDLRGKTHILHSAVAVAQNGKIVWSLCEDAKLTMRNLSTDFIKKHIEKSGNDLLQTVGGYQLENHGAQLFEKIDGDYFTILGLPLLPLLAFLRRIKFIDS